MCFLKGKCRIKPQCNPFTLDCLRICVVRFSVLLQAGADINAQDNDGWTPLHAAVHWGQEDSCQTLVDHLCDMDLKNNAVCSSLCEDLSV